MQKLIWLLNLRKCSKVNVFQFHLSWIGFLFLSSQTVAGSTPASLTHKFQNEIQKSKGASFENLVHNWEQEYGTSAFQPLIEIAANRKNEDAHRYIALMSAAKIGGTESAPLIGKFLKDTSWMVRSAALKALAALENPKTAESVLPLLKDPALVVRVEAVETVKILRPRGAAQALLATLEDPKNYHGGKAQWVPQKALGALVQMKAKGIISQLTTVLEKAQLQKDPDLKLKGKTTLKALQDAELSEIKGLAGP
jgi:hypothetical protein